MRKEEIDPKVWSTWLFKQKRDYFEKIKAKYPYDFYSSIKKTLKQIHKKGRNRHNLSIRHDISFNALSILRIFERDHYKCHYCGITQEEHFKIMEGRLTIDRLDSEKDYSIDNSVLACYMCNQIKGNILNEDEMCMIGPILYKAVQRKRAEYKSKYGNEDFNFYISIAVSVNKKPYKQGEKKLSVQDKYEKENY